MKYSVVIPVYRGEKTIGLLFERLQNFFIRNQYDFEVVFVYDCGPDNSWTIIEGLKNKFPHIVKGVRLTRNFGQHNAIICGFKYATGNFIITIDEDLQHEPEDIRILIEMQMRSDCDIVYGKYEERKHSFFRNITSNILKKMLSIGIPELHKDYTAFRLIRTCIAKETLNMNNSYTFLDGYLAWITNNVQSVTVKHIESQAGKSAYSTKKLIEHSINIFVTFSNLPIRVLTLFSSLILSISIIYSIYILFRKIVYNDFVTGFATFAIMGGVGIGLLLFGLGVIGEYLYRVNLKTTKRPNFLVKKVL